MILYDDLYLVNKGKLCGSPEWFNSVSFSTQWLDRKSRKHGSDFVNPFNTASGRQENLAVESIHSVDVYILNVSLLLFHLTAAKLWLSVGSLLLFCIPFCGVEWDSHQSILIHGIRRKSLPKSLGEHCNIFLIKYCYLKKNTSWSSQLGAEVIVLSRHYSYLTSHLILQQRKNCSCLSSVVWKQHQVCLIPLMTFWSFVADIFENICFRVLLM